jgi:hypothetical protein
MSKTTTIECNKVNGWRGDWSVQLTQDEEGYGFYVLDGREWVPWAEAASFDVVENCVRALPQVRTPIKENPRKSWQWNYQNAGQTKVSKVKVRNLLAKLLKGLEG